MAVVMQAVRHAPLEICNTRLGLKKNGPGGAMAMVVLHGVVGYQLIHQSVITLKTFKIERDEGSAGGVRSGSISGSR